MTDLARFRAAQDRIWPRPIEELARGRKTTYWSWFVLPQLSGLGQSAMAQAYGIADLPEAADYLADPVLRARLVEVAELMRAAGDAEAVLGPVDAIKLRSCITLFEAVPGAPPVFAEVIDRLYGGDRCPLTSARLARD